MTKGLGHKGWRSPYAQEKEHKYLVRSDAWREIAEPEDHYRQGYLSIEPDRSIRVRAGTNKAFITIKGKNGNRDNGSGISRSEFEYPIPIEDANRLLDRVCQKSLIEKTRYRVAPNGTIWTIDEFANENRDLLLAEVETKSGQRPRNLGSERMCRTTAATKTSTSLSTRFRSGAAAGKNRIPSTI